MTQVAPEDRVSPGRFAHEAAGQAPAPIKAAVAAELAPQSRKIRTLFWVRRILFSFGIGGSAATAMDMTNDLFAHITMLTELGKAMATLIAFMKDHSLAGFILLGVIGLFAVHRLIGYVIEDYLDGNYKPSGK